MFTIEDCAKRLHSINGSSQCINSRDANSTHFNLSDLTQWMEDNSKDARQIVDMIRDMVKSSRFSPLLWHIASYQTILYLFYLSNSVLIRERSTGIFTVRYYRYFILFLVYISFCRSAPLYGHSFSGVCRLFISIWSCRSIKSSDIAKRILSVIRLWKEKHTMGRSMTSNILKSIPVEVL